MMALTGVVSAMLGRAEGRNVGAIHRQRKLSAAQALEILGLKAGATEQEIRTRTLVSQTFLPHNLMR